MSLKEFSSCLTHLEKDAGVGDAVKFLRNKAQGFGNALTGKNVRQAFEQSHADVMGTPIIKSTLKETPKSQKVFSEQIAEMLHKRQKIPVEILESGARKKDLVEALEKGQGAVSKARAHRRLARGVTTLGVGTPIAAAVNAQYSDPVKTGAEKSLGDKAKDLVPAVAAAGAGSIPMVHGLKSQALKVRGDTGQQFSNLKELHKAIKPGDVLMTADPGKGGMWKPVISALGGDPTGYHVETTVGKGRGLNVHQVHASPGQGGAANYSDALHPGEDVIVRRFKNRKEREAYLRAVKERNKIENAYGAVMGERAQGRMYAKSQAVRGAFRSLLPGPLSKLIRDPSSLSGMANCSSLTGQCSPVSLAPGVQGKDILPHHIRSSKALETIGTYHAPQKMHQKAYNAALRAAPWLIRGAAGAGLGYGAYRGAKALMDR